MTNKVSALWFAMAMAMAHATTTGCAVELEDPAAADEQSVLDHIEALGLEREATVVLEDRVVVEGDMLFDRAALLRGEYERPHAPETLELIEKGYRYPSLIAAKHRSNIRLRFAGGRFAPTKQIRSEVLAAAKAWSAVPGSSIRISPDNTGPEIVVHTVPAELWLTSSAPGCETTSACAHAPRDGNPGAKLFIRKAPLVSHAGCSSWSSSILAHVTRHELGHTLGFAHPRQGRSLHVKGTKPCTAATEKDCVNKPGYVTVMSAPKLEGPCTWSPVRVTQDDYATCAAVYPAKN